MANETKDLAAEDIKGALYQSLSRNNKEIKNDRAEIIAEDLEMSFSQGIQLSTKNLKQLLRERANMYDFSPTNTQSLVMAHDVKSEAIFAKDLNLSIRIRQAEIELEILKERYEFLFGKTITI